MSPLKTHHKRNDNKVTLLVDFVTPPILLVILHSKCLQNVMLDEFRGEDIIQQSQNLLFISKAIFHVFSILLETKKCYVTKE